MAYHLFSNFEQCEHTPPFRGSNHDFDLHGGANLSEETLFRIRRYLLEFGFQVQHFN